MLFMLVVMLVMLLMLLMLLMLVMLVMLVMLHAPGTGRAGSRGRWRGRSTSDVGPMWVRCGSG